MGGTRECIMHLKPGAEGRSKSAVQWYYGIYVGISRRTEESLVGTDSVVTPVRSRRRRGVKELHLIMQIFDELNGVPWEPIPGI